MNVHRQELGVAVLGGLLYAVGGYDGRCFLNAVERWDPGTGQWSSICPMSVQRSGIGVAVLNDKLYAVGGASDYCSCLNTVECYDPHTNKWTPCAPMSKRRDDVGVGVVNGCLYALGGYDGSLTNLNETSTLECVERYKAAVTLYVKTFKLYIMRCNNIDMILKPIRGLWLRQ
ncbi:uncharacterized protein [Temnothorax longispinosus]|uniref:uncharacterized protein n=1 Tax=Temnothorax longispinosus TaxID=300112 RepID=UPI003A99EF68